MIPVAEGGWVPFAPSAAEYKEGETVPVALDVRGNSGGNALKRRAAQ